VARYQPPRRTPTTLAQPPRRTPTALAQLPWEAGGAQPLPFGETALAHEARTR